MNHDELRAFHNRIKKTLNKDSIIYAAEPKLDGLGVELVYENGILSHGSTRGDGFQGEDVTHNLRTIRSIPLTLRNHKLPLPKILEVRGEVFMSKKDFAQLNPRLINFLLHSYLLKVNDETLELQLLYGIFRLSKYSWIFPFSAGSPCNAMNT